MKAFSRCPWPVRGRGRAHPCAAPFRQHPPPIAGPWAGRGHTGDLYPARRSGRPDRLPDPRRGDRAAAGGRGAHRSRGPRLEGRVRRAGDRPCGQPQRRVSRPCFKALTGSRQHTGNWSGKTVANAYGAMRCGSTPMTLVDLPGTYSLRAARPKSARRATFSPRARRM